IKQCSGHSIMTSEYSDSEPMFGYTTDPFAFTVKWKSNDQTLFNPSSDESDPYNALAFKDQCLEISTKLPNDSLGGAFDFYSFSGPTPVPVGDRYTALIGRPAPMLYGALVSRGLLTRGLEWQHPTS
ncbi:Glycosidase, partial [Sarracenia purpurea var. burkii]